MRRAIPLLICLLLALMPATAVAKKKHRKRGLGPVVTVTATGNAAPSGQESVATATCPAGLFAVGGGFSAPITATQSMVVHDSYRSSAQAWTAAGRAFTGTSSVTAFAYCRRAGKNPVTEVTATAPVAADGTPGTATMSCPTGRLIGGGFQSTVGPGARQVALVEVNASTSATSWSVTAVANDAGAQTLTGHAYCMSGIRAPVLVSASNSGNVALRESVTATTPKCPVNKKKRRKHRRPPRRLSAGGFSGTIGTPSGAVGVMSESRLGPTGWTATDVNGNNTAGTISLTSQGICF